MNFIDFVQYVKTQCMHETIYEDSDSNLILVTRMLDAYAMANKMVAAEREKYEAIITNMTKLLEAQQNREGVAVDMIAAGIAAEREACAKLCEEMRTYVDRNNAVTQASANECANAIRARGQA